MTHIWSMYDPYMTHLTHVCLCITHVTHAWPMYDPSITHLTHYYPCVANVWPMYGPHDPYMSHIYYITNVWPMYDPCMTHTWPTWHTWHTWPIPMYDPCINRIPMYDPHDLCMAYVWPIRAMLTHMAHPWLTYDHDPYMTNNGTYMGHLGHVRVNRGSHPSIGHMGQV